MTGQADSSSIPVWESLLEKTSPYRASCDRLKKSLCNTLTLLSAYKFTLERGWKLQDAIKYLFWLHIIIIIWILDCWMVDSILIIGLTVRLLRSLKSKNQMTSIIYLLDADRRMVKLHPNWDVYFATNQNKQVVKYLLLWLLN